MIVCTLSLQKNQMQQFLISLQALVQQATLL